MKRHQKLIIRLGTMNISLWVATDHTTTHNTQLQLQPPKPQPQPHTTEHLFKFFLHEANNSPTDEWAKARELWLSGQFRLLRTERAD